RKARRVYSLASRLPGTNRLGFQPSMALSGGIFQDCFFVLLTYRSPIISLYISARTTQTLRKLHL
ncbi:MAG: hypothetical protein KZQ78_15640, partial [Candidatus Thiodiazotropha sp. (ex Ustalcina ferruginea)]|nr:hypothetical protein [Candidatus Thiodiazotropha sp. (ex Ustalcina ferruginea)]